MIKEKSINILMRNNIKYYREKGYICSYNKESIIKIFDLSPSCKKKVTAICKICEKESVISYVKYLDNFNRHGYYGCKKCSRLKSKKTSLEKWGVDNYMKTQEGKDKVEKSNLIKYGVTTTLLETNTIEKIHKTNIERYGHIHPLSNKDIRNKAWDAFEAKYDSKTYTTSKIYNDKILHKYKDILEDFELYEYKDNCITLKHNICNSIEQIPLYLISNRNYQNIEICTNCNPLNNKVSSKENEVREFLDELNINYSSNIRHILNGKELDIYIKEKNMAIEFNGLYWHSELFKNKNYHNDKTINCNNQNIDLIHIFEDDWNMRRDIVKSIIKNRLGVSDKIIYGRKCVIKYVKSSDVRIFLDNNHIQGFSRSTYKIGLYYENRLVSLMTFGYRNINGKKEFELIRFCNEINTNVIGATSKLFKHFTKNIKPSLNITKMISYADTSIFKGSVYDKLGFSFDTLSAPSYYWVVNSIREARFKFNKKKLISEGYDSEKTEVEIMHERGYYRIWGCSQKRYVYNFDNEYKNTC